MSLDAAPRPLGPHVRLPPRAQPRVHPRRLQQQHPPRGGLRPLCSWRDEFAFSPQRFLNSARATTDAAAACVCLQCTDTRDALAKVPAPRCHPEATRTCCRCTVAHATGARELRCHAWRMGAVGIPPPMAHAGTAPGPCSLKNDLGSSPKRVHGASGSTPNRTNASRTRTLPWYTA